MKQNHLQKKFKFTAALLSLALLFSVLAVPASAANISTWATRADDLPGQTAIVWFTREALEDMEGTTSTAEIKETLLAGGAVQGQKYTYKDHKLVEISMWSYAGLSQTETTDTIYWYDEAGYDAWIDALNSEQVSINWSNGYVTVYPGTSNAKVVKPCSVGTDGNTGLTVGAGDYVLGHGKTAVLIAGGAVAFIVAAKLYDDPTILANAKQKAQDFFGGIADTVQGWLARSAPAEADAAAAQQPAQSDTPAA
jgi:hypothetical protein